MLQNRLFFALASRSGFGAAISDPVVRSSIICCNSVSADRIVMAASGLLLAVAACVILLSFAADDRKSYCSGCIKAEPNWFISRFSRFLVLIIFLFKILLKSSIELMICDGWIFVFDRSLFRYAEVLVGSCMKCLTLSTTIHWICIFSYVSMLFRYVVLSTEKAMLSCDARSCV